MKNNYNKYVKNRYKCKDCDNKVSYHTYHYGLGRCAKCSHLKDKNGRYVDGRSIDKHYCIKCKKEINWKTDYKGNKRCQSCFAKERFSIPENNTNWIDGSSFKPYTIEFTEKLKRLIRERDNHKCLICNKFGNEVHHIDYNKQNCKEDNLITLCIRCHRKTNFNRSFWKYFFDVLRGN